MIKRGCILVTLLFSFSFPGSAWGVLHYYSGTMDSKFEMTHYFYILVPSGLTSLTFTVTLPENYSLPNSTQAITDLNFSYSTTPSLEDDDYIDNYDNNYKKIVWENPTEDIIYVTMTYSVSSSSDWNKFVTLDSFPFNSSGLPESVTEFIEPSDQVQSNDPMFLNLAADLTNGLTTQWEALTALNGWIIDNILYGDNPYGYDALSTLYLRLGNCSNYAHIALALVRAAGIPARLTHGYSLQKQYTPPNLGYPTDWGQGSHAWLEVYYPSLGWIPYDPQRDFHHVDTHRVLFGRGADTKGIMGDISSTSGSIPAGYPEVYYRISANWIDDSIDLSYLKSTDEVSKADPYTYYALGSAVTYIQKHTIIASTEGDGSISPEGRVFADIGSDLTFTITPDPGYYVEDVSVDGYKKGSLSSYTFDNVAADHEITARFLIEDSDEDDLPDWWEQQIIDNNESDSINNFEDVIPNDDFDGDNFSNLEEYQEGTDPTDAASHPPRPMPWLILLLED